MTGYLTYAVLDGYVMLSIEIWSDEKEREFGIKVSGESHFRALTGNSVNLIKIVHSSPYFEEFRDAWQSALLNWVRLREQRRKKAPQQEIQNLGSG